MICLVMDVIICVSNNWQKCSKMAIFRAKDALGFDFSILRGRKMSVYRTLALSFAVNGNTLTKVALLP